MMQSGLNKAIPWLWAAVWFTLPVSMKANAAALVLLGVASLARALVIKPVTGRKPLILAGLFILLFLWHGAGLLFDPDRHEVWKSLERKLSLVAIPVMMILLAGMGKELEKWTLRGFFAGLAVTGLHMLVLTLADILGGRPVETFTYHAFTEPYAIGAIYYSCYLSAALYFLAFRRPEEQIDRFRLPLGIFFLILLLFSASKLFIVLTIPAAIWLIIKKYLKNRGTNRFVIPILFLFILILGSIPFFNRISELGNTDFSVVSQEKYSYDTPWNGLTFRMVLWRFAGEILEEKNAWLTGTGIGSRQDILNTHYKEHGIYLGNEELGDTGYLDYNFHNQYLETLVGTGIPGLLILGAILIFIFFTGMGKQFFPWMVYLLIAIFFCTESMLERQSGIVFFCLIWTMPMHRMEKPWSINGIAFHNRP